MVVLEKKTKTSSYQVNKSLQDGLECLLQLASMERPVGSRELSRILGQESTRTNRFLSTLASMGFAQQTPDRKYLPGQGLHILTALSLRGSHLLECALPRLRALGLETGLRVVLGFRWRTHVTYLFHGHVSKNMVAGIAGRDLYPVDRSSIGIMLLTERTSDQIHSLYDSPGNDVTTHPDMDDLLRKVDEARERGYSMDENNYSFGVRIGSPAIAGLGLARDPLEEELPFTGDEVEKWIKPLKRAAEEIALARARRL